MRPVDTHAIEHLDIANNTEARDILYEHIGVYCSYCEMRIDNMGEREHVIPTNKGGHLTHLANNLLACKYCNTRKSDVNDSRNNYIWPDRDNTFLAFQYFDDGQVLVNLHNTHAYYGHADRLWSLCGLNNAPEQGEADRRRRSRIEAWTHATDAYVNWITYQQDDTNALRRASIIQTIAIAASGGGFFSVWMTVFRDVPEVRKAIITRFIGTATDCFDANGDPVQRVGGNI